MEEQGEQGEQEKIQMKGRAGKAGSAGKAGKDKFKKTNWGQVLFGTCAPWKAI